MNYENLMFLYTYTPSQSVDSIRISVLPDKTQILKKSIILKISKTFILHNNNAAKLLTNW